MRTEHATTTWVPGARQSEIADRFPGEPLDRLVEHFRLHPRVDAAAFLVLEHDRPRLRPVASWFASPALAAAMQPVMERPYEPGRPAVAEAVLDHGQPLCLPRVERSDEADAVRHTLERAGGHMGEELWRAFGPGSVIACAVRDSGGRTVGVLEVASLDPSRPLTPDDVGMVEVMADMAAIARERSALQEQGTQERRLSRALTRGFIPDSPPVVEDFEVASLYEPSGGHAAGGDIYGLWRRPGGDLLLVIGDVSGKGQSVAGTSAMIRFFVEARSWDGAGPGEALRRVASMLTDRLPAETFATAFLAVLGGNRLVCANAGHLPPLVSRAGRSAEPLEVRGLALGVDPCARYEERELHLTAGDLLYAYTDGLTEARRGDEMYGMQRLESALDAERARNRTMDGLVEAMHESVRNWAGALTDDAVSLAVRRR